MLVLGDIFLAVSDSVAHIEALSILNWDKIQGSFEMLKLKIMLQGT